MTTSDLIQPRHLARSAVIYVRQASPYQVLNNTEIARLQYALVQCACELGWLEPDVVVVDDDTGRSASSTANRLGFQQLVAKVGLGAVGVIVAYDAARLARNCTHWYQLLDLCGHTDCLIADRNGSMIQVQLTGAYCLG